MSNAARSRGRAFAGLASRVGTAYIRAMTPHVEKRLLQIAIAVGGAFSLLFGATSVWRGVEVLIPDGGVPNLNVDSHFRYLSGIFLGVIIAFYACIPTIERRGARFRLLGGLVIAGGVARLIGVVTMGVPGTGHLIGLALELVVTPILLMWQARLARRMSAREPGA